MKIVLASQSPRRQELLKWVVPDFEVAFSNVDETTFLEEDPAHLALRLARAKALAVAPQFSSAVVIGCDTTVFIEGHILGKPKGEQEAFAMLQALSGRSHQVTTGTCLVHEGKTRSFSVQTNVTFYPLSVDEMEEYIRTGEPFDKAGGYGIQGLGALFVKQIAGDYYNVVGLPVARLKRELRRFMNLK